MYPFSYRDWATLMVWRAEKRSLRAASCCSVDVMNGAAGRREYGWGSRFEMRAGGGSGVFQRRSERRRGSLVELAHLRGERSRVVEVAARRHAGAVEAHKLRFEARIGIGGRHLGGEIPIGCCDKREALTFTVHD